MPPWHSHLCWALALWAGSSLISDGGWHAYFGGVVIALNTLMYFILWMIARDQRRRELRNNARVFASYWAMWCRSVHQRGGDV
jgi:di/tricarboxylate transporter